MDIISLIKKQEKAWETIKNQQVQDSSSIWYGAYDPADKIAMTGIIPDALCLYTCPHSKYYKDKDLLTRMELGVDFLLKVQTENGLISLWNCNIYSPPDTAFTINMLSACYLLIEKLTFPELDTLKNKLLQFLKRCIPGMVTGGFHTPNHRWVISCALGFLYKIFGDERLKQRAHQFLDEGFDVNDSGEWTERSNVIYNAVSDMYVYHIGEIFNIPQAFDAIRKNLDMMKYMFHPDFYIVTEYSTRQDKGTRARMDARYTIIYLLMAAKDNNPQYAYIAEKAIEYSDTFAEVLIYLALYDNIKIPAPEKISDEYTVLLNAQNISRVPKQFSEYGDAVLRYRKNKLSVTVMAGQQEFMYVQYGSARAFGIKFPVAWFGLGGVSFEGIKQVADNAYEMSTELTGKYWDVFDKKTAEKYNNNFIKMPNESRKNINVVKTNVIIKIKFTDNDILLDITSDTLPMIFTQLVFMFDADGSVYAEQSKKMQNGAILLENGELVYSHGKDCIAVNGTSSGHNFDMLRGDTFNEKAQNVILNAMSPKNWAIKIKCFDK